MIRTAVDRAAGTCVGTGRRFSLALNVVEHMLGDATTERPPAASCTGEAKDSSKTRAAPSDASDLEQVPHKPNFKKNNAN